MAEKFRTINRQTAWSTDGRKNHYKNLINYFTNRSFYFFISCDWNPKNEEFLNCIASTSFRHKRIVVTILANYHIILLNIPCKKHECTIRTSFIRLIHSLGIPCKHYINQLSLSVKACIHNYVLTVFSGI